MTSKLVGDRLVCGHKMSFDTAGGTTTYTCILRKNHDGHHYESFTAWNDLGEQVAIDDTVKRERGEVERSIVGSGDDASPKERAGVEVAAGGKTRRRRVVSQSPSAHLPADTYPPNEGEPNSPILMQGKAVNVTLGNVVAYDHKNPRQMPLVEEARRLMAAKVAHEKNPAYCDLIERVSDLYSSIPVLGLIEPIVVEEIEGGRWELKAGWRRMTALLLLYGEDCQTIAVTSAVDPAKATLAALAENVSRRDMPWHLQAVRFAELQKQYTTKELSDATGVSISSINNQTRVRNKLHPAIWAVVCKWGGTPRAVKIEPMLRLVSKEPEEQLLLWQQMTEGNTSGKPLPPSSGPEARPAIDPTDLLVQRQPEVVVRAMNEGETKDFLAVLRQAFATHDAYPKDNETRRAYRFALGAVEAIVGQPSTHTELLRSELAKTRTLSETLAKDAHARGSKGTTPATVAKRGAVKPEEKKAPKQRAARGARKAAATPEATKKAAPRRGGRNAK
jgi:hypothetical protein